MKAFTDISQSKKLAKILPIESADMYYFRQIDDDYFPPNVESIRPIPLFKDGKEDFNYDISCWSLAALLNLLPSEITYSETIYEIKIRKYTLTEGVDMYQIAYGSIKIDVDGQFSFKDMVNTCEKENLIDVAFDMILKLKERDLI